MRWPSSAVSPCAPDRFVRIDFVPVKTNAPRLITIGIALVLTIAGLHLTGTITIDLVGDLIRSAGFGDFGKDEGYLALLASPLILIAGSFLPNL